MRAVAETDGFLDRRGVDEGDLQSLKRRLVGLSLSPIYISVLQPIGAPICARQPMLRWSGVRSRVAVERKLNPLTTGT